MESPAPALKEEHVSLKSRIAVSLSDGAVQVMQNLAAGGALTYYFTRIRGLDPDLAGLVWLIFGVWNAVNDPLFGFLSDRTRHRLGRRIPYIRFGSPIIALSFVLLWLSFPGLDQQTGLFIQLLVGLFIYDSLYTAIATSIYIMPFEIALSNRARSSILVWKIVFSTLAMAATLILLPMIQPGPGDDPRPFLWIMAAAGVLSGLTIFLSTFFYKEKHFQQEQTQYPFFKSLITCFKNFPFIIFEVMSFTIMYLNTGLMQGVLYYFDEFEISPLPLYLALGLGILGGIVFFIRTEEKLGLRTLLMVWTGGFAVGCFALAFGGRFLPVAALAFFLVGMGFAGGVYLIPLMNGDVIDYDEHLTGLRREGMYAGINSFVAKPAVSVAQAVFLWFLVRYGYDQTAAKGLQTAAAEQGILLGWGLVPGVLLVICTVLLIWYPLHGHQWNSIKARLITQHQEKEKRFLEKHGIKYRES
jgi:GPH family glycoside/pentoside/hexuronide:cation symporter